jgi:hypothetical protein
MRRQLIFANGGPGVGVGLGVGVGFAGLGGISGCAVPAGGDGVAAV